ncbi:DUF192 domain-containing protein [Acidiferrobacter sp.]|jgi:uncharacterized membrane protein (UPF0127 family)|uniref:DUF192 domain-containing protein n=1 Tax=Acidiferrobacter sp. TaxID=1872107 RepID=UPI002629F42F|nr:DUF192 domain-containing protein [Acidiferrobacter sp.]
MKTAVLRRGFQALGPVKVADGPWSRGLGLVGRKIWAQDQALLLIPCRAIHTFGMRFGIDVVFVDRQGVITALYAHMAPWRWVREKNAYATLEWVAGAIHRHRLKVGEQLVWSDS